MNDFNYFTTLIENVIEGILWLIERIIKIFNRWLFIYFENILLEITFDKTYRNLKLF